MCLMEEYVHPLVITYAHFCQLGEYMVPLTVMYRNKAYGQLQVKVCGAKFTSASFFVAI